MRPACPRACLVRALCWPGGSHALPPWPGSATEAGTKSYLTSHPGASHATSTHRRDPALLGAWRSPRQTVRSGPWLWLGGLGIAAAADGEQPAVPAEAVTAAVLSAVVGSGTGANLLLVDPASRAGSDLAAVGDALASLRLEADARVRSPQVAARAAVARSSLVLASKAGRLPLPEEGRKAAAWGRMPASELAGPGGRACLHPGECLEPLLNQTLAALNVASLDLLLFEGAFEDHPRDQAEARLARAFAWAERERVAGRIGAYGVSEREALTTGAASLARLVRLATAAVPGGSGPGHGFRFVSAPATPAAWTTPSQPLDPSTLAGGALAAPVPLSRDGGWGSAVAAAGRTAGDATAPCAPLVEAAARMGVGVLLETADGAAAAAAAGIPGVSAALVSVVRPQAAVAADLEAFVAGAGTAREN